MVIRHKVSENAPPALFLSDHSKLESGLVSAGLIFPANPEYEVPNPYGSKDDSSAAMQEKALVSALNTARKL